MPSHVRALITIPTKNRVGLFPMVVVLATGGLAFILSFQYFFFDLKYALSTKLYFDPQVLDTLVLLQLPCSLLFCFVLSQVRIRLCWKALNFWSLTNGALAIIVCIQAICFIVARPNQAFSFMMSLVEDSTAETAFEGIIKLCKKLCKEGSPLWKSYNDPDNGAYNASMLFASWPFVFQFCVALCFTILQSAQFGEKEVIVTIKDVEGGSFLALTQAPTKRLKFGAEAVDNTEKKQEKEAKTRRGKQVSFNEQWKQQYKQDKRTQQLMEQQQLGMAQGIL